MSPNKSDILLRESFAKAQENLSPIYGDKLRLLPLANNMPEVVEAFEQQWKPFFDSNPDLEEQYYLSLFDMHARYTHFNIAVWHEDYLCGIAMGGYANEDSLDYTSIQVAQGSPDIKHPFKGRLTEIIHEAAIEYAKTVGKNQIVYVGGYSPGAIKKLERMGLDLETVKCHNDGFMRAYVCNF